MSIPITSIQVLHVLDPGGRRVALWSIIYKDSSLNRSLTSIVLLLSTSRSVLRSPMTTLWLKFELNSRKLDRNRGSASKDT